MWRRLFLIVLLSASCIPALAFERPFPANAKRGTMTPGTYPEIVIDGQTRRLSQGARIWNRNNLIQMPAYLHGSDMTVNYTETVDGINRIWILTPEEAERPLPTEK